ncbi:MAG: cache domain-containing protein, partial [Deltaproteobacteria bacterium]|nr:cache domain-containing protein [Deltaproteobacteria bacterium]
KLEQARWIEEVNRTRQPYISEAAVKNTSPARTLIAMVSPVYDNERRLTGLAVAIQNLSFYTEFYTRLSARPGRTFYLLDNTGQVIAGDIDAAYRWGRFQLAQYLA